MALKIIESRIDKKGRIYLPSKIRRIDFFKQKTFRLLPIVRTSTKQTEKGLLLINPTDEFDATYFWGNYDMKERYTVGYDPRGRLTTTENIMKDLGLHPFAYKYVSLVESCFGWELWPEHRLKRILRTFIAYKIKLANSVNIQDMSAEPWFDARLNERFLFSKEAGRDVFLKTVKKDRETKKEKTFFLLEKINSAWLLSGGSMKDTKKEINFFVNSRGYHFALPFLDTETRIVPSGTIRMSYWKSNNAMRIAIQRIRNLSIMERSEITASHYASFSYKGAKKLMERGQLLERSFSIDNSEVHISFCPIPINKRIIEDKSFKTFQLMSKRTDVFFNKNSHANIEIEFYKRC